MYDFAEMITTTTMSRPSSCIFGPSRCVSVAAAAVLAFLSVRLADV